MEPVAHKRPEKHVMSGQLSQGFLTLQSSDVTDDPAKLAAGKIYFKPPPDLPGVWHSLHVSREEKVYRLCGDTELHPLKDRGGSRLGVSIPPRQAVVLAADEIVGVPNDVTAVFATSYPLAEEGLQVIVGKLDPGELPPKRPRLVLVNHSRKRIVVLSGERVASIAFVRITAPVTPPVPREDSVFQTDHRVTLRTRLSDFWHGLRLRDALIALLLTIAGGIIVLVAQHYIHF